jgi:hypothetical protein
VKPCFCDHQPNPASTHTIELIQRPARKKVNEMFSTSNYDRFGGRGRGRGRSVYSSARRGRGQNRRSSAPETPRSPSPPFGPVLTTIRYSELKADQVSSGDVNITRLEDVTSYNWLKAKEPTIVVPGSYPRNSSSHNLKQT